MKVIIIGATSGIGEALAKVMAKEKYELGLTGRRVQILETLQKALPTKVHIQQMDVAKTEEARADFLALIERMGGVDIVVINAGIGSITSRWDKELPTIQINATGFAAIANAAFYYFEKENNGQGHIVGISSLAALRGSGRGPVYNATKAFISSYMQGLYYRAAQKKLNIAITDIRPGFVKTPMTEQNDFMFWVVPVDKAATQIFSAIRKRKKVAYISKRWRLIAWVMKLMPDFVFKNIG